MISTFPRFLFSKPAHWHGCTDTKFSVNATKHFGSWTFIADDRLCVMNAYVQNKKDSHMPAQLSWQGKLYCSAH